MECKKVLNGQSLDMQNADAQPTREQTKAETETRFHAGRPEAICSAASTF